jgi:hypothetical protein
MKHSRADPKKLRKSLRKEVTKRLNAMGYWDYIPIPRAADEESRLKGDLTDSE